MTSIVHFVVELLTRRRVCCTVFCVQYSCSSRFGGVTHDAALCRTRASVYGPSSFESRRLLPAG